LILLERLDAVAVLAQGGDAQGGGPGPAHRGHDGRARIDGRRADFHLVSARRLARRGVDDQLDLAVLQEIQRVGPALGELEDAPDFEAGLFQHGGRAGGGNQLEAQVGEEFAHRRKALLVGVAHADEDATAQRERAAGGHL